MLERFGIREYHAAQEQQHDHDRRHGEVDTVEDLGSVAHAAHQLARRGAGHLRPAGCACRGRPLMGRMAMTNTSTPMPPTQWVKLRQNRPPRLRGSTCRQNGWRRWW